MKCPFPGVDPYLESQGFWADFHARFITYLSDQIADKLPSRYHASIGERISLITHDEASRQAKIVIPDVAIIRDQSSAGSAASTSAVAEARPTTIPHRMDSQEELRQTFVEIVRRDDHSLVTVIELLSPSNKCEPGLSQYVQKQKQLLREDVNLLELDLLLGGQRLKLQRPLPPGHAYALLSRAQNRPNCEVYAWDLRSPIPTIPVPLSAPDRDIEVDLAAVFEVAYQRGRYADVVHYDSRPSLAVDSETLAWVHACAAAQTDG